jgi:hypothetical protein
MGHIKVSGTRADATPTEWLGVGASIGKLANTWAGRDDLVAYVGNGAGGVAPACYNPQLAEVEVNVEIAFGKGVTPKHIGDLTQRSTQYEFPKAIGAIMHEAFHAKFSKWSMPKAFEELERDEYDALILLEESRIEAQGMLSISKARPFLRACALEIVIGDFNEDAENNTNTQSLTNLVGLVYGRVDAGVLDFNEVLKVTKILDDQLGLEVVAKLRSLAMQAQAHNLHNDATNLYPIAKEWAKIVRELAKERGDDQPNDKGGCGLPMPKDILEKIMEALEDSSEGVSVNNYDELADAEQAEENKEQVKSKAQEAEEQMKNKDVAKEVFEKRAGTEGGSKTSSKLLEEREPTSEEKIASVKIGKWLDRAKYRERDITEIKSEMPPGRMNTRAIVQREAQRSRGVFTKAEPFSKKVRKFTDEPTLSVGVMVDISGSMGSAMKPMATTAWVMANAVKRIQGRCGMVYFGSDVFPTLKAGQRLDKVKVFSASDHTEQFEKAFRALDGELNLLNGQGARLLVIVSDGQYTDSETKFAQQAIKKCEKAGVAVLWLPFDNGYSAERISNNYAEIVKNISNPAEASEIIGKACASVITRVGQRAVA